MNFSPGDTIEKYVIESVLGEGGMAVVYKVRHQTLDTQYALKILKVTHEHIRNRMIREGQVQARLRHPNIVSVVDVITIGDSPGLLMEFIEGKPLDELIEEQKLPIKETEEIFLQILEALRVAHSLKIIHRDLKPANILIETRWGKRVAKVCDFGLAKAMEEEDQGFTKTGVTMGTPAYMAPEQVRNAKTVDQRADIFALGTILYEMVTGQQAFQGTDTLELLMAVAKDPHQPPERIIESLPKRISAAINGALEKNPDHRIPDCEIFRKILLGEMETHKKKVVQDTLFDLDLGDDVDFSNPSNEEKEVISSDPYSRTNIKQRLQGTNHQYQQNFQSIEVLPNQVGETMVPIVVDKKSSNTSQTHSFPPNSNGPSSLENMIVQSQIRLNVWWYPELHIVDWAQGNNNLGIEFSPVQGGWYQAQRITKTPQFFKIPEDTQKIRIPSSDGKNVEVPIVYQKNLVTDVIFDPDSGIVYNPNRKSVRLRLSADPIFDKTVGSLDMSEKVSYEIRRRDYWLCVEIRVLDEQGLHPTQIHWLAPQKKPCLDVAFQFEQGKHVLKLCSKNTSPFPTRITLIIQSLLKEYGTKFFPLELETDIPHTMDLSERLFYDRFLVVTPTFFEMQLLYPISKTPIRVPVLQKEAINSANPWSFVKHLHRPQELSKCCRAHFHAPVIENNKVWWKTWENMTARLPSISNKFLKSTHQRFLITQFQPSDVNCFARVQLEYLLREWGR